MSHESGKSIKARLWDETRLMLWIFLYIFLFLTALAAYRAVLLGGKGAALSAIVQCFVEAMVIAKVMVIGNALRLGDHLPLRRRALRIVMRSFMFVVFTMLFSALEEWVVGLYHGHTTAQMIEQLREFGPRLVLARGVVLFIFYTPLFLIWEVCRIFGEARAIIIFFAPEHEHPPAPSTH